jgi:hypothetical protein
MSSSNSNLPVILLVVIAILALGGFYYADRSSSTIDIAAITDTADTESMVKSKKKYDADKSVFSHAGYTGSSEDYLSRFSDGAPKPPKDVKQHSGYSGSADEYVSKHSSDEIAMLESNANHHSGFSGSMKDYAAGKFSTRSPSSSSSPSKASAAPKTAPKSTSNNSNANSHSGYKGSVNDYLDKYK